MVLAGPGQEGALGCALPEIGGTGAGELSLAPSAQRRRSQTQAPLALAPPPPGRRSPAGGQGSGVPRPSSLGWAPGGARWGEGWAGLGAHRQSWGACLGGTEVGAQLPDLTAAQGVSPEV